MNHCRSSKVRDIFVILKKNPNKHIRGETLVRLLSQSPCCLKKKKLTWAEKRRKVNNVDLALKHFDHFYPSVINEKWPSVRIALLSQNMYCAVVNNFSNDDEIYKRLIDFGAVDVGQHATRLLEKLQKNVPKQKICNVEQTNYDSRDDSGPEKIYQEIRHSSSESDNSSYHDPQLDYFVPVTQYKGEDTEVINETDYFDSYKQEKKYDNSFISSEIYNFPKNLKVLAFERGEYNFFPPPPSDEANLIQYYLMDTASLFPVIAMNLSPGNEVLDLCASPGGKSLLMIQTLLLKSLCSNDIQLSRVSKLQRVISQYIPKLDSLRDTIAVTHLDGKRHELFPKFDKILVDVPCSNDRKSVIENDNNIFKASRSKERMCLPELQTELLMSALKMVKPGGSVVYSTCSLSPLQNDGVVNMALRKMNDEGHSNFAVCDLSVLAQSFSFIFRCSNTQYGKLILPYLPMNYGPMYVSKIKNISI